MRTPIRILALAVCLGVSSPAASQNDGTPFGTGNQFVRLCGTRVWQLACRAYALGVYHGNQMGIETICLPRGVDTGQMYEVALAYIRANPQTSHNAAFAMILDSWRSAFPCR